MAKSVAELACEPLDAEIARLQTQIDGLERAKELVRANSSAAPAAEPKKRGRKRKGLPSGTSETASFV